MSFIQLVTSSNDIDMAIKFGPKKTFSSSNKKLFLLHAPDHTGHRAYYFLKPNILKVAHLERVIDGGIPFDLEKFGEIVARGYGEVPADVLERMRAEHGWKG